MRIILDAHGGDRGCAEVLRAADAAVKNGIEITVAGEEDILKREAADAGISLKNIAVAPSGRSFPDNAEVTDILDEYRDSSLCTGLRLLADNKGDAFISAANTGALFTAAVFFTGRLPGVKKAAAAALIPTLRGKTLLLDAGANLSCSPEDIKSFADMGIAYLSALRVKKPYLALLNIGAEENKGTSVYRESNKLLRESFPGCFTGNAEGRDIPFGKADIVVCGGFEGNIFLKTYEGAAMAVMKCIKDIYNKNIVNKMSALAVRKDMMKLKSRMDYKSFGAAPILGLGKPVFKAHGSSGAEAYFSAVMTAAGIHGKSV